jgi:nitroimidazol reductase NimA-like FMN-containing flavoprotein (pyridoxamine 5'-phosphate oxidase superfamily)
VPESRELGIGDCLALLRAHVAGRVAVSTPTGPHMVPVNYAVVDDAIIMRTTPYSLLGTYGRDAILAFEIDGFDSVRQRGWSVLARGPGEVVDDHAEIERLREVPQSQPWASGSRPLYLRLRWTELTGRQLGAHWDPLGESPDDA